MSCQILHVPICWGVRNELILFVTLWIVSYLSIFHSCYFFSRYKGCILPSFSSYGSLSGALFWVLHISVIKPFLAHPFPFGWVKLHSVCISDSCCYITVFFLFCSQFSLKFLILCILFCLLLNSEVVFQREPQAPRYFYLLWRLSFSHGYFSMFVWINTGFHLLLVIPDLPLFTQPALQLTSPNIIS